MNENPHRELAEQPHAVVIGDLEVARRACSELVAHGLEVSHLLHPSDLEVRAELTPRGAVAILVRGDVTALPPCPCRERPRKLADRPCVTSRP